MLSSPPRFARSLFFDDPFPGHVLRRQGEAEHRGTVRPDLFFDIVRITGEKQAQTPTDRKSLSAPCIRDKSRIAADSQL